MVGSIDGGGSPDGGDGDIALATLADVLHGVAYFRDAATGAIAFAGSGAERILGRRPDDLRDPATEAAAPLVHPDDLAGFEEFGARVARGGETREGEFRIRNGAGEWRLMRFRERVASRLPDGAPARTIGVALDVSEERRMERLLESEARVLDLISSGAPLGEVLEEIVRIVEGFSPGTIGSILLLDRDGSRLRFGAGANMPADYTAATDGALIGPKAGSCGTAAYRRAPVVAADIESDPLWDDYRDLARPHGFRACWSTPIEDSRGRVVGTFAMYRREPGTPSERDFDLVARLTHLAGAAIERRRGEEELRASEERFLKAFEHAAIGMALVAPDGRWLKVNRSLCELTGYAEDDLLAGRFQDITHPEDLDADLKLVGRMLADEIRTYRMEKRYIHRSGRIVRVLLCVSLVRDAEGEPIYFVSQIVDMDERRRAEEERERARFMLAERVKELSVLHGVAAILQGEGGTDAERLARVVSLLPFGWQHCDVCAARIVFDAVEHRSPGFRETPWMQRAGFRTRDGREGAVEVAYLEKRPAQVEGPFFEEERDLIATIAEMLRADLSRRGAETEAVRRLEHIAALHAIDAAILAESPPDAVFDVALEQVEKRLGADACAVLRLAPESRELVHLAARGFRGNAIASARSRPGRGIAGRAALERRSAGVSEIEGEPEAGSPEAALRAEGIVACGAAPLVAKGRLLGALLVGRRERFAPDEEWIECMKGLAGQIAIAMDSLDLLEGLRKTNALLSLAYDSTLEGWVKALDLRDKETEGHSTRVTETTVALARAAGFAEEDLIHVRRGALLHDVGKLGIPDAILLKPGPLTDEEWAVMRLHPVYAHDWLSPIEFLRPALPIPWCHHEKWDGSGYPRGLAGEDIPLAARLFAAVDVFDALTSDRPYRARWTKERSLDHIRSQSGRHFDPEVVALFERTFA